MRKVLGAKSWQLAQQFMTETLVVLILALSISLVLVYLVEPFLGEIFGTTILIELLVQPGMIALILGMLMTC